MAGGRSIAKTPPDRGRGLLLPAGQTAPFCVCVPARTEAARLGHFLAALAVQDLGGSIPVVLCINNSSDASIAVLRRCRSDYAGRLDIWLDHHVFPPPLAHAGSARRRAMDFGVELLDRAPGAVLLSTDADTRPPPDWIRQILCAVAAGADIVGGRLLIDEDEPLPDALQRMLTLLDRYWAQVRDIEDAIDPRPWDLPPRHGDHTGASLALTVGLYRAAGGVPPVPCLEDRLLVGAAVAAGGRLVHPPSIWTRVSPRRDGRAADGMAAAMARFHAAAASGRPLMMPALEHWRRRARWRRALRAQPGGTMLIALQEPLLPPLPEDMALVESVMSPRVPRRRLALGTDLVPPAA